MSDTINNEYHFEYEGNLFIVEIKPKRKIIVEIEDHEIDTLQQILDTCFGLATDYYVFAPTSEGGYSNGDCWLEQERAKIAQGLIDKIESAQ